MKALELFCFEMGYQSRRLWTWAYFFAMLAVVYLIAIRGYVESSQEGGYWFNAPYGVALMTLIASIMGLLVAAAFAGEAGARDPETRMASLVYASPVRERSYVSGRFVAAFLMNALVLTMAQVALIVATLTVDTPPELIGPINIATYLTSYVLLALPNAFLATALLFALSILTRRSVASYLGAVILFFTSILIYLVVAQKLGMWELAKIIDPMGLSVLREISLSTTAAQKNALSLWSSPAMLLNRAVWLSVAAVIIAFTHVRFRFEASRTRGWLRREAADVDVADGAVPISVPSVQTSKGTQARLSQLVAVATQSFREVAISPGGLVLVILTVITIVLGPRAMAHMGVPVIPTTEQMINWIGHPGEILWFIVPILTTFYAGELVWRDRETRLSEIADAAPVPEWVQLAGKYIGLAGMLFAYQLMLVIACMLIQAQMGYYNFEVGLYMKTALGLSMVEHLLFAALAFALHVIINQKYVSYLAILAIYAFMGGAGSLGIPRIFVYASSPDWSYSDMKGFGPSIAPWAWFKLYWTAWAVVLSIVATLMWVRGREPGFRARLRMMRERAGIRSVGTIAAMVLLIAGTAGFIRYNTNVLNKPYSESAELERRAEYEKTYARFSSLAQPQLTAISLRVEIHPQDREATLHTTYSLVNNTAAPIGSIHLLPENGGVTGAIRFNRPVHTAVDDETHAYRIYELTTPLAPGDSIQASFDVLSNPRGFTNNGTNPWVAANGTYLDAEPMLPKIGYQREREIGGTLDRVKHSLRPRADVPSLDDSAALYGRTAKRIAFEAIIGTDEDQTAVAPGQLRRTWMENGRRYFHYVADAPIRNDFSIYSAHYAVDTAKWNDVTIEIVHDPRHGANVDRMIASARASLDYFTKTFGPYPYREMRFVEYPGQSMTLHSSPINISYQEAFSGMNPAADKRKVDFAFAVAAHEIAHQWWGNQLSPADVEGGPLLSESLAWYSAMCIVAHTYGEDHVQRLLDMMHEGAWTISSRASVPLIRIYSRFAAYRKGPFAVNAMRAYVGEDRVTIALQRLFEKYKSAEPPLPTSLDLMAELKAVTPDSLQSLLSDLFEKNTWWELETKKVAVSPLQDGQWKVDIDVKARKVTVDTKGTETEVPMDDLVEIGVYRAGGEATRGVELYRVLHRVKAGEQRITVVVEAKPVRAGIDPRYLLTDDEPTDNIRDAGQ